MSAAKYYGTVDALILQSLARVPYPIKFKELFVDEVLKECERLALGEPLRWNGPTPAQRILDRRLQALRKAGKVDFCKGALGGWSDVSP